MTLKPIIRVHLYAEPNAQAGKVTRVSSDELESGDWKITQKVAESSLGAELHLHEVQQERSWRAGKITAWRLHQSGNGRVVFRFRVDDTLRRFQRSGWPHRGEQRIVREGDPD